MGAICVAKLGPAPVPVDGEQPRRAQALERRVARRGRQPEPLGHLGRGPAARGVPTHEEEHLELVETGKALLEEREHLGWNVAVGHGSTGLRYRPPRAAPPLLV